MILRFVVGFKGIIFGKKKNGEIHLADSLYCYRCRHDWLPRKKDVTVCPRCIPPDSIVSGDYKPIQDYTIGSMAIAFDGLEHGVIKTYRHDYNGDMLSIKASGCLPLRVTSNHNVLISHCKQFGARKLSKFSREYGQPEYIRADQAILRPLSGNINSHGDYLVIPKIKGQKYEHLDLLRYTNKQGRAVALGRNAMVSWPINETTAWIMGLYVAEGCSEPNKGQIRFCLGKHEKDIIERLISSWHEISPYNPNPRTTKSVTEVFIYSRLIARAFIDWFGHGAKNKRIPDFILKNSNKSILESFLIGYLQGDGCVSVTGCRTRINASTVSKTLAIQLQALVIRLGDMFNITKSDMTGYEHEIDGRKIKYGIIYMLRAGAGPIANLMGLTNKSRHNKSFVMFDDYVLVPINSITVKKYTGLVMNLETGAGNYLVNNMVVKNCHSPYFRKPVRNRPAYGKPSVERTAVTK